jgi:hypothetical protein
VQDSSGFLWTGEGALFRGEGAVPRCGSSA